MRSRERPLDLHAGSCGPLCGQPLPRTVSKTVTRGLPGEPPLHAALHTAQVRGRLERHVAWRKVSPSPVLCASQPAGSVPVVLQVQAVRTRPGRCCEHFNLVEGMLVPEPLVTGVR